MGYQRLTREERYQISALKTSKLSIREIAVQLGRSPSTISRELSRNIAPSGWYAPAKAHKMAMARRKVIHPPYKVTGSLRRTIIHRLNSQWSPEQITGILARRGTRISTETIYQFIYREFRKGNKIYLNCRRKRKYRRTRKATFNYKNKRPKTHYPNISERPDIVEKRVRLGDYERDTVRGIHGQSRLLTIVDRTSRRAFLKKIPSLNAEITHYATVQMLKGRTVHTITNDNGQEFRAFRATENTLKTKVFFNDPYCSWQRGTNENLNGLVRQYFPKGTNFDNISDKEIRMVERKLNTRPRKTFGYLTPIEVERSLSQSVALRN